MVAFIGHRPCHLHILQSLMHQSSGGSHRRTHCAPTFLFICSYWQCGVVHEWYAQFHCDILQYSGFMSLLFTGDSRIKFHCCHGYKSAVKPKPAEVKEYNFPSSSIHKQVMLEAQANFFVSDKRRGHVQVRPQPLACQSVRFQQHYFQFVVDGAHYSDTLKNMPLHSA